MKISGNVGIGTVSPGYKLDVNGNIGASGFYYTSDISLKEDIKPIFNALESIKKLNGVEFRWKESGRQDLGLIAQDVERVFPDLVQINNSTGLKSVEYGNLVAPLIEAIKEQQKQIEELKNEIKQIKAN